MRRYKEEDTNTDLNFYTKLPISSINSTILDSFLKKRFTILKNIEKLFADHKNFSNIDNIIFTNMNKSEHTTINTNLSKVDDDIISHFSLKLIAACNLNTLKWFINVESLLFLKKMDNMKSIEIKDYFYKKFIKHISNLTICANTISIPYDSEYTIGTYKYVVNNDYKLNIHFTKVLNIINVKFPRDGYVIDASNYIKSCMFNFYKEYLTKTGYNLFKKLKNEPDERIQYLHDAIFIKATATQNKSLQAVQDYFPPCILGLIKKLESLRHLKYKDRLILTRFFKDSGILVEATIDFFKSNFKVPERVFNNKYLYSIRHSYGLEGKRASYSSYDCKRVMESYDNETFGCPFKSNKGYLKEYGRLKNVDIEDTGGDCMSSCTRLLEKVSGKGVAKVITKPIEFLNIYSGLKEEKN